MKARNAIVALALAGGLVPACAASHIGTYTPKKREYDSPAPSAKEEAALSTGSLWRDGRPASLLFTDARALRTNDLVVIQIEEEAEAQRQANTDLDHESSTAAQIDEFLGVVAKLKSAGINPALGGSSTSTFKGEGQTQRTEHFTATVPAIVRKVLPNGNLFVEGHRVILVNNEEQHFYISGVVRPIDIDQQNSVKSSLVADAQIEFVGRGVLTDNQQQGVLSRFLGWIWPF